MDMNKVKHLYGISGQEEALAIKTIEKESAHCPKCGDEVLGDEDGLCGYCAGEAYELSEDFKMENDLE